MRIAALGTLSVSSELAPLVAFGFEGKSAYIHAFVPGIGNPDAGVPGFVQDILVYTQTDSQTAFATEAPLGVAVQNGYLAVCDASGGGLLATSYALSALGMGSAVWEGACGSLVSVPGSTVVAMQASSGDGGSEILLLDTAKGFAVTASVVPPPGLVLSTNLPLAAASSTVVAVASSNTATGQAQAGSIVTIDLSSSPAVFVAGGEDGGALNAVALSADGTTAYGAWVGFSGGPFFIKVLDLSTHAFTATVTLRAPPVALALSPDDLTLAVLESDPQGPPQIEVIDTGEVSVIQTLPTTVQIGANAGFGFSPDGTLLLVGTQEVEFFTLE